jgi:mannose-6-phosphate isomerase-like protein (cupin superfamily)
MATDLPVRIWLTRLFSMKKLLRVGACVLCASVMSHPVGAAQTAPPQAAASAAASPLPQSQSQPELLNLADLAERARPLLDEARAGNGSALLTLEHYPGHATMLIARTASGRAELHKHYADFLFVLSGEGTELTGGTMIDPKDGPDGEVTAQRLENAERRALRKGDVIHIPAGTPHETIEGPGQFITIFAIKVEEPQKS